MTRFGSAALALIVFLCAGCHDAQDMNGSQAPPPSAMSYLGYDDTGRLVVTGWIDLGIVTVPVPPVPPVPPTSLNFSGTWELHPEPNPGIIGSQNGSGVLAWGFVGDSIGVELHPELVDNNVSLLGTMSAGASGRLRYEGTWRYQGIGGGGGGTFRAWRLRRGYFGWPCSAFPLTRRMSLRSRWVTCGTRQAPQDGLKSNRKKSAALTTSMLSGERPPDRRRCTVIREVHAEGTPGAHSSRTVAGHSRSSTGGADRRLRRTTGARRVPSRPGTERPFDRGGDPAAPTPAVGRETAEQAVPLPCPIMPRRSIPCSREVMVDAH